MSKTLEGIRSALEEMEESSDKDEWGDSVVQLSTVNRVMTNLIATQEAIEEEEQNE